ncbi:MAG: hypothetical protein QME68_03735 [Elusimicrobiota bacterium]|nr:hypothetical protein [Elusimicrobiota bacterium]
MMHPKFEAGFKAQMALEAVIRREGASGRNYSEFYNNEQLHQALNYKIPLQIYPGGSPTTDGSNLDGVCFQTPAFAIN